MKFLRLLSLLCLLVAAAIVINDYAIPNHNTAATHLDTLIILGTSANTNGTPSLEQLERVHEAVREYKAGTARHMIMTGGAAHTPFVEAHVMAVIASQQGIPAEAIIEEPQALNTIQNIYYSSQIMHARGWKSAEVISSPDHIGRAAMILAAFAKERPELAIQWRTHAAPWPSGYPFKYKALLYALEASRCLYIRVVGFPKSEFLPGR